MSGKETNGNPLTGDKERSEVLSALKKSALGYETQETVVAKTKAGQPVARKTTKIVRPDPKAAKAFLELSQQGEQPKKNKWLQITDDERILVSTSKLADVCGVSVVTVNTWERQGCPKEKRGWWDLRAVIAWRGRAVGIQGGADALADKLSADIRLKNARATLAEQELLVKSGELISMVLVEERLTELFGNLRTSIMGIADHIMTELYSQYPELAPQVRRLVDVYIREALKQIADNGGVLRAGRPDKKAVGRPRKTAQKSISKPKA